MIKSCLKWGVNAWVTSFAAFAVSSMLLSPAGGGTLMQGLSAALLASVFSPTFIVPAAVAASLLERYWDDHPSGLVLGIIAGLLVTLWTGWPAIISIGSIAGGTAGWMSDRGLRPLSARWCAATAIGGLLAGIAGEVAYRFFTLGSVGRGRP